MQRRGTTRLGVLLVSMAVALIATFGGLSSSSVHAMAAPAAVASPVDSERDIPVPTVSDFIPEDANLSDCIGLVERPGCGSEARGGLGQTMVFIALALGLGVIFWRVSLGVRANRAAMNPTPDAPADVD